MLTRKLVYRSRKTLRHKRGGSHGKSLSEIMDAPHKTLEDILIEKKLLIQGKDDLSKDFLIDMINQKYKGLTTRDNGKSSRIHVYLKDRENKLRTDVHNILKEKFAEDKEMVEHLMRELNNMLFEYNRLKTDKQKMNYVEQIQVQSRSRILNDTTTNTLRTVLERKFVKEKNLQSKPSKEILLKIVAELDKAIDENTDTERLKDEILEDERPEIQNSSKLQNRIVNFINKYKVLRKEEKQFMNAIPTFFSKSLHSRKLNTDVLENIVKMSRSYRTKLAENYSKSAK